MKLDQYRTLMLEFWGWPGNIGDSCAETSRYLHLCALLDITLPNADLNAFVTKDGFIRHPTAPAKGQLGPDSPSWRETDFSADQAVPFFLAARKTLSPHAQLMRMRIKANWYRTGNNNLVNPGFYALLAGKQWLLNISMFVQALLLRFPYRWSDSKNKFEESEDSSADYLNYLHTAVYVPKLLRKIISKDLLKSKIRDYYKDEVNKQFLIDLYDQVIDKYF